MLRIVSNYIRQGDDILDLGCGSGFFSSYFISKGSNVYSMDYSREALSLTKDSTKDLARGYMYGDILDEAFLSGIDRKFDIIFTDGLLEHYSKNEQDRVLVNMKRLKKENGSMINFVPNRFSFWSMVRPFYMSIEEEPFLMSGFLDLHRRNGLRVVSYGGLNVVPFRASPERLLGMYAGMLFYCIAV